MKKELALSKDLIQKEGIEIKITQADVIDVLVAQQMEHIMSQFRNLENRSIELKAVIDAERNNAIEKAIAKVKIPEGLTFNRHKICSTKSVDNESITLTTIKPDDRGHTMHLYSSKSTYHSYLQIVFEISVKITISDIELSGYLPECTVKYKMSKKLIDKILIHNAQVKVFEEIFPASGINEKRIAKEIKNKFTKDMIKSMSPEFQRTLSSSFAIV